MNDLHNPGSFFTVTDEDIRGEYGNQRDDHGRFFCGLMYGLSITAGVMFLAYFMWVGMGIAKVDALRHQEAFSGYRTASCPATFGTDPLTTFGADPCGVLPVSRV